jgi:nucleotide-binding universal stress UspA family protein
MGEGDRVVVGVDGSASSLRALRWAADQARRTGNRLVVVTTWEFPTTYGWVPPYPPDFDPGGDARRLLQEAVASELGDDPGVEVELVVEEGHAAPVLVQQAKDATLLVVGSRGHGGFAGMLLGSVSEHCVHHAACPVIVIRDRHDRG